MPSRPRVTPDTFIPSDEQILDVVRRRPGASLREIAAAIYPDTAWRSSGGGADSMERVREYPAPLGPGRPGNRLLRMGAGEYLRDRLAELVEAGALRHAPRRRDEGDLLASLSYYAAGAELRASMG